MSTIKRKYKINNYICEFIRNNWFDPEDSNDKLASFFVVHDSIIAKIKSPAGLKTPTSKETRQDLLMIIEIILLYEFHLEKTLVLLLVAF